MNRSTDKRAYRPLITAAAVILALLCLVPIPTRIKDGGSLYLSPVIPLYSVTRWNGMLGENARSAGVTVILLGREICSSYHMEGGDSMAVSYTQITQDEAKEMMTWEDGHVILDVRRQDEYDAGHIPGAILIPNESIGTEPPAELPDKDQIILIYCRSGNRSKQAAQKLFDMGYTNIYEFGGINTWTGETVTDESGK